RITGLPPASSSTLRGRRVEPRRAGITTLNATSEAAAALTDRALRPTGCGLLLRASPESRRGPDRPVATRDTTARRARHAIPTAPWSPGTREYRAGAYPSSHRPQAVDRFSHALLIGALEARRHRQHPPARARETGAFDRVLLGHHQRQRIGN